MHPKQNCKEEEPWPVAQSGALPCIPKGRVFDSRSGRQPADVSLSHSLFPSPALPLSLSLKSISISLVRIEEKRKKWGVVMQMTLELARCERAGWALRAQFCARRASGPISPSLCRRTPDGEPAAKPHFCLWSAWNVSVLYIQSGQMWRWLPRPCCLLRLPSSWTRTPRAGWSSSVWKTAVKPKQG